MHRTCGVLRHWGRRAPFVLALAVIAGGCGQSATQPERTFDPLVVDSVSLASGLEGVAYSASLTAHGGDGVYTWSLASGTLPPGMSLSSAGRIAGTPATSANESFSVRVVSGDGQTAESELSLVVHAVLTITTDTLPVGYIGAPYDEPVSAIGGDGDYTWTLLGVLPDGLVLDETTGHITGTPTADMGAAFTIRVESGDGQTADMKLTLATSPALEIVTSTLPDGRVGLLYQQALASLHGEGSRSWSLVGGVVPDGLSLDSAGEIKGTPTTEGSTTLTVRVETPDGQVAEADISLRILGVFAVTTTALRTGIEGSAYADTVAANGGVGPYTWSIVAGTLPSGLSLDSGTGEISGTPTAVGSAAFSIRVESADGQSDTAALTITIHPALAITTSSLPTADKGLAYSQSVAATGGDGSYTWSISLGSLPAGLDLSPSTGAISGTPTTVETASFTVRVDSGDGQSAEASLSIEVTDMLDLLTTSLGPGVLGQPYSETLSARGGGGSYTWTLSAGTLPSGISLDASTGEIAGTPTAPGDATFTIRVDSGDGQAAQRAFTISVYEQLAITTGSLPGATQGFAYDESVAASGGDGSYAWSVTVGALPAGIGLTASTGRVSGTPTDVETADFTLQVASGDGQTTTAAFSVDVAQLILSPSELCSDNPSTAVATFADGNLETVVRQALGVSPATDLTCALVATATGIAGGSAGITDLTGAQNLTGLKTAYVVDNPLISDWTPLGQLTQLEGINVSDNSLTDLDAFAGLTALTLLIADGNGITDVSGISALTALDHLDLRNNAIADISALSGMTAMTTLELQDNSITDLSPLSGMTGLLYLYLHYNSISNVSALSGITSLMVLELHNNSISDISALAGLTALQHLTLEFNSITDISALSGMTDMVYLRVYKNSITDISPVAGMTSLEFLHFTHNSVSDISSLSGLTSLKHFAGSSNSITDITALQGLPSLEVVSLDGNTGVADIQPLIANPGIGAGDLVQLWSTDVTCSDIATLEAKGASVSSDCLTPYEFCNGNSGAKPTFADSALDSAVRAALGIAVNDVLWCGDVMGLGTLDASSSGVTDLAGIQNATGLTQLIVSDNGVSDISYLNRLTVLEDLQLSQNSVTDLTSLVGLTSLTNVLLDDNPGLSDIQPLLDNTGIGSGDTIDLTNTAVACSDVTSLRATGATVTSPTCP